MLLVNEVNAVAFIDGVRFSGSSILVLVDTACKFIVTRIPIGSESSSHCSNGCCF